MNGRKNRESPVVWFSFIYPIHYHSPFPTPSAHQSHTIIAYIPGPLRQLTQLGFTVTAFDLPLLRETSPCAFATTSTTTLLLLPPLPLLSLRACTRLPPLSTRDPLSPRSHGICLRSTWPPPAHASSPPLPPGHPKVYLLSLLRLIPLTLPPPLPPPPLPNQVFDLLT